MVKSEQDVVKEFNEIVNMTADELDAFLKTDESKTTGWTKEGEGEAVGHESGRKIVDILKRNPSKDASKYTDEDKEHMRKVVSYCARHLAQEAHLKDEKSKEELEHTKSTRSLKNWGHDPLKANAKASGGKPKSSGKPVSKKADAPVEKPKSAAKPTSKKADAPAATDKEKEDEKPKSAAKPASKKAEKPTSKKAEPKAQAEEKKAEEAKSEKPKSSGKPASKKATGAAGAAAAEKKKADEAETGEKREAEKPAPKEKPASKKAKTDKPVSEGTRKPPSRVAKKG